MSKTLKNLFLLSSIAISLTACHTTNGYDDGPVMVDEFDTYPGPYNGYYGEDYNYVHGHHDGHGHGHHHGGHHHHHR